VFGYHHRGAILIVLAISDGGDFGVFNLHWRLCRDGIQTLVAWCVITSG
jgi:hypothetical protein